MLKKYKMGFDIWALVVFLIIMIPNFIWSAVPAPDDILRTESATKVIDTIGSIFQVLMIFTLCVFINPERNKLSFTKTIIAMICCIVIYFCSWVFYYLGVTNGLVILGLTIPPCVAFLFFAVDRKNYISVIPIAIFTVCHIIFGVVNFII
ncbi:MAG: hypothetical protein J6A25_02405 [Lachnospiraceae bacterium]|nr:hypothetical protein [Lachnospiraceae bacterium]